LTVGMHTLTTAVSAIETQEGKQAVSQQCNY
jgi:hypothetical protein